MTIPPMQTTNTHCPKNHRSKSRNYHGFTLVELIVVITILVILGTIAFVSLSGYSGSARDGSRVSDITNLKKSLELANIKTGSYPTPTDGSGVTFSGGIVWVQGSIGDSVINTLNAAGFKLSKKPTDPKYSSTEYAYSLLNTGKEYQVGTVLEDSNTAAHRSLITPVYAADNLTAYIGGNYNGLVAKAQTGTTTYYLTLPSIVLQNISNANFRELTNAATQSGNLVLHKKGNLPSTYTNNSIVSTTPAITFSALSNSNQLVSGSGIVAYTSTTSSLDSTGVTSLMNNLYNLYNASNLKGETASVGQVASLITGGSGSATLSTLYNGVVSKSVGGNVVTIITNNCNATTYSGATVTALAHGVSQNFTQPITYGTGDVTATCTNGAVSYGSVNTVCSVNYVASGSWNCIQDTCTGSAPPNSQINGTQGTATWAHSTTPGICKFQCQAGYYWNGTNACVAASPGYYAAAAGLSVQTACTTGQYQDTVAQTTFKSCSNKPTASTYTASTALTTNTCPWSCDAGYIPSGGSCIFVTASCSAQKTMYPSSANGVYAIDPDGIGGNPAFDVYCDMTTDGGGWTLAIRLNTNDANSRNWTDTAFWGSATEVGTLSGNNDYLSKSVGLVPKNILLKYTYQNNATEGIWSVYNNASNTATFNANLNLGLSNTNTAWTRGSYSSATAITTDFYGSSMRFETLGNDADHSRIFYNSTNNVAACNQGGSIGHIGDYGSNNWSWEVARGWPDASAGGGCQHNSLKLGLGTNYNPVAWGVTAVTPADLYSQGIMYIMIR